MRTRFCFGFMTIGILAAALVTGNMTGGCSKVTDKLVGEASRSGLTIDFGKCTGTDCDTDVKAQPLQSTTARSCEEAQTRNVTPDWVKYYGNDLVPCQIGQCRQSSMQMAVAADNSVWISAELTTEQWDGNVGGVRLAHYGQDGALLHDPIIVDFEVADRDMEVEYETRMAADSRGRIRLAVNRSIGELEGDDKRNSRLFEFDSEGNQVGEPAVLQGATVREMRFDAEDNLYILAYPDEGYEELALAKVNAEDQLIWVQNSVGGPNSTTNIDAFTVAPDGTVTTRGFRQGRIAAEDGIVISHFDSDGSILWELKPTSMDSWINNEMLGADVESNILRGSYLDTMFMPEEQPGNVPRFRLEKFSDGGELIWAIEQPVNLDAEGFAPEVHTCSPVADADGNIYLGSADILQGDQEQVVIRHVSADGSDCGLIVVDIDEQELFFIESLALGPGGKLYFIGQWGFGVLNL